MSRFLNILCSPFKKNFSFFLVLAILASIADVIAWMIYGEPIFAVYLGLHGFLMCYVIALIFNIIRYKLLRKIYAVVFISLGVISFFDIWGIPNEFMFASRIMLAVNFIPSIILFFSCAFDKAFSEVPRGTDLYVADD